MCGVNLKKKKKHKGHKKTIFFQSKMELVPYVAESAMTSFGVGTAITPETAGYAVGFGIGEELVRHGVETLKDRLTEFMHYGANKGLEIGKEKAANAYQLAKRKFSKLKVQQFSNENLTKKFTRLDRNRGAPGYKGIYRTGTMESFPFATLKRSYRTRKRTYKKRRF